MICLSRVACQWLRLSRLLCVYNFRHGYWSTKVRSIRPDKNAQYIHSNQKLYSDSDSGDLITYPEVQRYLSKVAEEYKTLQGEQTDTIPTKNKRLSELKPLMDILREKHILVANFTALSELEKANPEDKELLSSIQTERQEYLEKMEELNIQLCEVLLPENPDDHCQNVILEVSAGVGGQEAMLFAHEMLDMYYGYINFKGWDYEVAHLDNTELGGLRHASLCISGQEVFQHFKYEAGVHRVQRVPSTERSGRVHTSTVSVATLPQPEEVDVILKDKDLRIETKRSSGAGGQHVNTTDSAVRITHIPTGLSVECQVDRSQIKNRRLALQRLKAKIYQQEMDVQTAATSATRKSQVGSSFRSEKIRTYNFNQDRITDHRVGETFYNMRSFMLGREQLDFLIKQLHAAAARERVIQVVRSLN